MKQRGLGRGLDAIFGTDKPSIKATPMNQMAQIAIDKIIPNPTQPRTKFDNEALTELADSIRQLGIIQPITVKRSEDDNYIIISGERRWRASQIVGLEQLPAYIREADDEDLHAMALDECGLTQEQMADKVGKKRSTVSNYMRLLNLPNEVQLALKEGLITMGHAKAIAGIDGERQVWALKKCIKKALSVRQAEELARKLAEQTEVANITDDEYPESYTRLVEQLEPYFSQNISIKRSKNGGGKIVIEFTDDNEIEQFIERFKKN